MAAVTGISSDPDEEESYAIELDKRAKYGLSLEHFSLYIRDDDTTCPDENKFYWNSAMESELNAVASCRRRSELCELLKDLSKI